MMKNDAVRRSRLCALALAVALAVIHPGCGNDSSNGPETFTESSPVSVLGFFALTFTAQRNGTVEVDVNWNSSGNDIDVYATAGTCANMEAVLAGSCNVVAFSDSGTAKPERISFSATTGQNYRVFAFNLGPGSDTVTIRLTAR